MDFKSLLSKINELDNSPQNLKPELDDTPATEEMVAPADTGMTTDQPLVDADVEECGMPNMTASAPKQQDNVSMNINMSGQGAGGIKDLMAILRDIEHGGSADKDMVIGVGETNPDGGFGTATTEPNEITRSMGAVTPTGDDLHSKGREAEKVNGGGNPFNVDESLLSKLENLYNEVKTR